MRRSGEQRIRRSWLTLVLALCVLLGALSQSPVGGWLRNARSGVVQSEAGWGGEAAGHGRMLLDATPAGGGSAPSATITLSIAVAATNLCSAAAVLGAEQRAVAAVQSALADEPLGSSHATTVSVVVSQTVCIFPFFPCAVSEPGGDIDMCA